MTARGDPSAPPGRIAVSVAISDPRLARRIALLLSGDDGLDVSFGLDDGRDPDVILADHIIGLPAPAIIIDDGSQSSDTADADIRDADVRAVLPPGVDGELLRAVIRVASAGFAISQAHELHDVRDVLLRRDRAIAGDPVLTSRELEVLELLAHGASNKLIARELAISVHTAKFHVASLLAKLGARNRSDAVALGIRRGLVLL